MEAGKRPPCKRKAVVFAGPLEFSCQLMEGKTCTGLGFSLFTRLLLAELLTALMKCKWEMANVPVILTQRRSFLHVLFQCS